MVLFFFFFASCGTVDFLNDAALFDDGLIILEMTLISRAGNQSREAHYLCAALIDHKY